MLLFLIFFFFLTYIGSISYFSTNKIWSFIFAIVLCIILNFFGKVKSLKGKLLYDWIRQNHFIFHLTNVNDLLSQLQII